MIPTSVFDMCTIRLKECGLAGVWLAVFSCESFCSVLQCAYDNSDPRRLGVLKVIITRPVVRADTDVQVSEI